MSAQVIPFRKSRNTSWYYFRKYAYAVIEISAVWTLIMFWFSHRLWSNLNEWYKAGCTIWFMGIAIIGLTIYVMGSNRKLSRSFRGHY